MLAAIAQARGLAACLADDADADGVTDAADNCPLLANPGQEDLDGDLLGNEEESKLGTNPYDVDTDVDGLTDNTYFTVSTQGSNGTAAINAETGAWTFTPTDPNWFGSDSFEVTVTDDLGGTTTQTITVDLANVNDAVVGQLFFEKIECGPGDADAAGGRRAETADHRLDPLFEIDRHPFAAIEPDIGLIANRYQRAEKRSQADPSSKPQPQSSASCANWTSQLPATT